MRQCVYEPTLFITDFFVVCMSVCLLCLCVSVCVCVFRSFDRLIVSVPHTVVYLCVVSVTVSVQYCDKYTTSRTHQLCRLWRLFEYNVPIDRAYLFLYSLTLTRKHFQGLNLRRTLSCLAVCIGIDVSQL